MGRDLVGREDDRDAVGFRDVERLHHQFEAFLHSGGHQRHDDLVSMATPAHLHEIGLGRLGCEAGARPDALHVDDHHRDLSDDRHSEVFLHERESRPAGSGERLGPGQRRTDNRAHAGDFVLHLHVDAAKPRQISGTQFCDFG